eukprot:SAG11_NODE_2511_length_3268_cov_4.738403_6_plen_133_part_01
MGRNFVTRCVEEEALREPVVARAALEKEGLASALEGAGSRSEHADDLASSSVVREGAVAVPTGAAAAHSSMLPLRRGWDTRATEIGGGVDLAADGLGAIAEYGAFSAGLESVRLHNSEDRGDDEDEDDEDDVP